MKPPFGKLLRDSGVLPVLAACVIGLAAGASALLLDGYQRIGLLAHGIVPAIRADTGPSGDRSAWWITERLDGVDRP